MGKVTRPEDSSIEARLARLEERLDKKERSAQLGASAIHDGTLVVKGGAFEVQQPDGNSVVFFGPVLQGEAHSIGWIFRRHTGQVVFELAGAPDAQFWAMSDEQGNRIISDDAASGQGLATPYIPLTAIPTRYIDTFAGEATVSPTFDAVWTIQGTKQHPKIRVRLGVGLSDAGTSMEARLRNALTEEVITPTQSAGPGGSTALIFEGAVSGGHLSALKVEVDVRRTGGTGTVWTSLDFAEGKQS